MDITYIIPIHEFSEKVSELFNKALASINNIKEKDDRIIAIGPKSIKNEVEKCISDTNFTYIENEETDIATQINKAAFQCLTPYFSVLEFDDEYLPTWRKAIEKYSFKSSFVIPIDIIYNAQKEETASLFNEIALSPSFASDQGLGYLDEKCLEAYYEFNLSGGLFNTEDFIMIGGYKPSMKIAMWYEFMLRACHNSMPVYVAPKIAYKHTILRENSYSMLNNLQSEEEVKWLISTAKEEYFFKEDRKKEYKATGK